MEIIINNTIFKPYDEMYYISAHGEVYSTYSNKILKWNIDKDGYPRVDIHGKHIKIHKLVYLTWVSRDLKGLQINHIDDNKMNPFYQNLYLGTQKDNIADCIENGHRVGNIQYITIYDKQEKVILTFSPLYKFIEYCGHPCANGSIKRMFSKNWFKKRYEIIEYNNHKNVTTNPDECKDVGQSLSLFEAHCSL